MLRQAYDEQRGHTIDVLTLRPRGQSRYTKDLIRCISFGSGDEVDMFWGRRPQSRFVGTIEEEEGQLGDVVAAHFAGERFNDMMMIVERVRELENALAYF